MENNATITANATVTAKKNTPEPGASVKRFIKMAGGDPFRHARALEATFESYMREQNGYNRITTFANDFALADPLGTEAVVITYALAVKSYLDNYKYMTELILVLNFLCWFWHDNDELILAKQYAVLYHDCVSRFDDHYAPKKDDSEEVRKMKAEARAYEFEWTD